MIRLMHHVMMLLLHLLLRLRLMMVMMMMGMVLARARAATAAGMAQFLLLDALLEMHFGVTLLLIGSGELAAADVAGERFFA